MDVPFFHNPGPKQTCLFGWNEGVDCCRYTATRRGNLSFFYVGFLFLVHVCICCVKILLTQPKDSNMLLKPKIYITILFVYEVIAVMVLHCQTICTEMLGYTACNDWFRYFAFCVVIPGIVGLIWMWVKTIIHAYRHRFLRRARGALIDVLDGLRDKLADKISREDIEKYITVASLYGIRYYMAHNPRFREFLHEIVPESTTWDLDEDAPTRQTRRTKNTRRRK